MTPTLDLPFVRQQFPAFSAASLQGQSMFENAGGSFPCRQVVERLTHFYLETKVQPYYGYPTSQAAGERMDEAYRRLAPWLGVDAEDIYFGPSTTQNVSVLAQAAMGFLKPGDEIVVTNQDHEANIGAWRRLADRGMQVREWQVDRRTGSLQTSDLVELLSERTAIVAFSHCSNILGQVNPVADWCAAIRDAGAVSIVDGVSYAGHGFPDIQALGADVYMFSLYKTYGPHLGLMTMTEDVAARFANQSHYFNARERRKRLLPAGPDHAQIAAAQGIADYFDAVHDHHFHDQVSAAERRARVGALFHRAEQARLERLLAFIADRDDLRLLGPASSAGRAPTVTVVPSTVAPATLLTRLAERGIMSGAGHFYSPRLLGAMDVDSVTGANRFSLLHYTSADDVQQLIDALEHAL